MSDHREGHQQLQQIIQEFQEEYLNTPKGQDHLEWHTTEAQDVQRIFKEIERKYNANQSITDDMLNRLLPHLDTEYHRTHGYRVSTWPVILKEIRPWFENIGWKQPDEWDDTARAIFEAIQGVMNDDYEPWHDFVNSDLKRGFATGFISPILYCLNSRFPVINSKVIKSYRYCTEQLGKPDQIDAKLRNYFENAEKLRNLVSELAPLGIQDLAEFDVFCHYFVTHASLDETSDYAAWLFIANPEIFRWKQAFDDGAVHWTLSVGPSPQKLLREQIKQGDRAFGYQAGPDYELICELKVDSAPYQTPEQTWAVKLTPMRWIDPPISLSALKEHDTLKHLTFVRNPRLSISGIQPEQLSALEGLIETPEEPAVSPTDDLRQAILQAQHDTSHPDRFEELLTDLFGRLGFSAERFGGPSKTDVLVKANLGADSFSAVIDAKTAQAGAHVGTGHVDFDSIQEHMEEHAADRAAIVAPLYGGGKLLTRAQERQVPLLTTDTLVQVLKMHEQFPFGLQDLLMLFDHSKRSEDIAESLTRTHKSRLDLVSLTGTVLDLFERLQLRNDEDMPLTASGIYLVLHDRDERGDSPAVSLGSIQHVLDLLTNPVLQILEKRVEGYTMTIPPEAAKARVTALGDLISPLE